MYGDELIKCVQKLEDCLGEIKSLIRKMEDISTMVIKADVGSIEHEVAILYRDIEGKLKDLNDANNSFDAV